jgi:DNA-binding Lrp family transcriptional regulator
MATQNVQAAAQPLADPLDRQLVELLKVNARLPAVRLAKALGCSRSTVQAHLKALEDAGVITGYTVTLGALQQRPRIYSMVMACVDSRHEAAALKALARCYEIQKIYSVSGRFDFCVMLATESTAELEAVVDRIRSIRGIEVASSTIFLSVKLDRPD